MSYACPCCGFLTLSEQPPGTFEICPVCRWEDDDVQYRDPSYEGGANTISLDQARANFLAIGAMNNESLEFVRKPFLNEIPRHQDE